MFKWLYIAMLSHFPRITNNDLINQIHGEKIMKKISNKASDFLIEMETKRKIANEVYQAEKIKFLHKIIMKYQDQKSFMFWQKIINSIPFPVLTALDKNIDEMVKDGYPIKSKPAFFVSSLKKMGYKVGGWNE